MYNEWSYPFTAIIGQEAAKRAILLVLINPKIGSVLISGDKGTAKSTLVRGISPLLDDCRLIELPLNATEEQVIGGINVEKMVKTGVGSCEQGLLARAHKNILYVDEINLLSQNVTNIISEAIGSKIIHLEREGISDYYPSDFILIGTMNPEEGSLSTKLLDRFGLYVQVQSEKDVNVRKAIIQNRLDFERDRKGFSKRQLKFLTHLKKDILLARKFLNEIEITSDFRRLAAEIAIQACCEGHRADILLLETAKAIAALEGETKLSYAYMQEAAKYVLPHRMRDNNNIQPPPQASPEQEPSCDYDEGFEADLHKENQDNHNQELPEGELNNTTIDAPQGQFHLTLIESNMQKDLIKREGNGKRTRTKTNRKMGRYVKSIYPKGNMDDIAFGATMRVAALYQKHRESNGCFITIHSSDIRQKVREKRTGKIILFVVDASGSMGANRRMSAVKSAILSLLQEAYAKRDKVGLITFANNDSKVLLEPTRSIDLANKRLGEIPTGGNTPLSLGIETALNKLKYLSYKEVDYAPFLVLITDGRANGGATTFEDALLLCEEIQYLKTKSMVLDTESGFIKLGLAKELANALGGAYCQMGEFDQKDIVNAINTL